MLRRVQAQLSGARPVLRIWVASRILVAGLVVVLAWAFAVDAEQRQSAPGPWLMYRFSHWDSHLYSAIAIRGYPDADHPHSYYSFLPGFPWLLRYLSPPGVEVRWTGLVLVTLCSAGCALLLWRLALDMTGSEVASRWTVVAFTVAPLTVFFSVVYTEAPFTLLALGAWLAGRRRWWGTAGILAGLASTLRVTGPLLVVGLVVMYLLCERTGPWRWRLHPRALTLALGPAFIAAYFAWLHSRTGRWDAWSAAQRDGFGRATAPPWVGFQDAVHNVASAGSGHQLVTRLMELVAPFLCWAAVAWMVRRRWFPEAVFTALCAMSMSFSTIWVSSPRYLHGIFPVFVLVGLWLAARRRTTRVVAVAGSAIVAVWATWAWAMQWWLA